jgi:hypothetical protein
MIRTGDDYRESIRDGREVWINGERVADVPTHPAFRPIARSVSAIGRPPMRGVPQAEQLRTGGVTPQPGPIATSTSSSRGGVDSNGQGENDGQLARGMGDRRLPRCPQ